MKNHIDYENIDNPLQSIDGNNFDFRLTVGRQITNEIELQTHIFSDNISRLQLLGGETLTEFLNFDNLRNDYKTRDFDDIKSYQKINISLSSK